MKQFSNVSSKYGAPMGRRENLDNPETTVTVFKVLMVDGDYDDGGAYWGGSPSEPLFCARGDGFEAFTRAKNIDKARANFKDDYPALEFALDENEDLDRFVEGYLECAAWADAPEGSTAQFTNIEKKKARLVCERFMNKCGDLLKQATDRGRALEHLGHDFWLTRQHHGTGFGDRNELGDELGKALTDVAHTFGEVDLYAQGGWLYFDGE